MPSFSSILELCDLIGRERPEAVFIGGVAVYLHTVRAALAAVPPESSHDADFMISFSGYGALKDAEEITYNARLHKHQMLVGEVEFDIYVERLNRLVVEYDEIVTCAESIEGVPVACPEHLLILKLEAYDSRWNSSKGVKDRRDVARLGLMLAGTARTDLILPHLRDGLIGRLRDVAGSKVFHDLCGRNAHEAGRVRSVFGSFVEDLVR
jgi:hypothetical protein